MTEPSSTPVRKAGARRALAVAGLILLLGLIALYAARKLIAREVLVGWLRAHGVAAQAQVSSLGLGTFGGRLRLGDPKAPDATIEDVAVTYRLRGLGLEVRSVALRAPTLHVRLHDGRLSLGALDPLIAELRRKPPQPDTTAPRIVIEGGVLVLATDYGPLRLSGDGALEDGELTRLAVRGDPARLRGPGFEIETGPATGDLRTRGGTVSLTLQAPVTAARAGSIAVAGSQFSLTGAAPYPDLKRQRVDGAVTLRGALDGGQAVVAGGRLQAVHMRASFEGRAAGGLADLALSGAAAADLSGAGAAVGDARLGPLRIAMSAPDLAWSRREGSVTATSRASLSAQALAAGGLRLFQVTSQLQGRAAYDAGGGRAALTARLNGRGAWDGLGAVARTDDASVLALKRAAQGFRVSAAAVTVDLAPSGLRIALPRPAQVLSDSGGVLTVRGRGAAPVIGPRGGAFGLTLRGGDLPTVDADVRRLRIADGAFAAQGAVRASGSYGPAEDATLDVSGALTVRRGLMQFAADRCAPLTARKLVFGTNDVEHLSARLCPAGGPIFALSGTGWRLRGAFAGLAAEAPFLQARVTDGAGGLVASQTAGRLGVTATLDPASVTDTAARIRFNGLRIGGVARLAETHWTAGLAVTTPSGLPLAAVDLRHDTRDGRGGLTVDTGSLAFVEGGLQPIQLSPLAAPIASPAVGQARFAGRFDWTSDGVTSGGTLSLPGLDFQSPAGKVSGLRGEVVFSSLAPLVASPGQTLQAGAVDAAVPVTDLTATFGLDDKALRVTGGQAAVGGGLVRIESLSVPLAANAPMTGVLSLDGVQLHDLVEASPFGDRIDLDAKVSGRVPFQSQDGKVRVAAAELHAVQPGRLSIARDALSGVAAGGAVSAPTGVAAPLAGAAATPVAPNDTFTDFAYQALENLAFDKLDAAIASHDDGRLGVLAHIVGRHDPPKRQEIRLSLFDLIGRKFLNRPLPLPSDTGVDLTLDTTLNLDDLLADYAGYRQLRGSPAVQPPAPTPETRPLETPPMETPK